MFKFIKNKFLFIILISIATLVVLVIGAMSLYQDNSLVFANDGYIIETSTKTNTKYYFTANTKYKENVEEKITFSDKDSNEVSVEPASFVHYNNGNVSFLKKGALVNLADITSPMVSYYNITNENTIVYEEQHYTVTSNDKKISIESFIGRISDNKYLIAGKDLSLKIPTKEELIEGEYFEILFIEEGIVKIDNQEHSYQVTAQDSYLYIGENIAISLGDGKISHDGDVKMLLSQITINGDENIDLDVEDKTESGGSGDGSGSGTGEGSGEDGDETEAGEGLQDAGEGTGNSEGDGTGTGTGTGTGNGNGESGNKTTASPQIELIEAIVTSTEIDLTMQLNNANLAKGNVVAYLTNVSTGNKETPKRIDLVNGTFKLPYSALMPGTEYALTIVETEIDNEKQYFQKTFRTKKLGITLEKTYATDNSLSYSINFDENTDVSKVHISIYDNNGSNTSISPNEFTISRDDLNNTVTFTGLKSNTSYSVNIDTVWIDNIAYSNLYTINRIDTTLKQTPTISDVDVEANAEEIKFTIELKNVQDKDKSIISYTYNIYLANDITLENTKPEVQYSVTKNDSDPLVLNLNEISELKTGVDYRCKIIAQYNDNEMIREVSTDYSSNFLIKSKPKISFELKEADMSNVTGTITLIDANCTVPMSGRSCAPTSNKFTLRYYELEGEETTENDTEITFDSKTLTSEIKLPPEATKTLKSNTTYAVKVFGSYYDDDNVLRYDLQIGDAFYVTTDKSPEMQFVVVGDNKSGEANPADVVTFQARLTAPQNVDLETLISEEMKSLTLNLYNGRYNAKNELIGTYTITDKATIENFFNNRTITNSLFEDVTEKKVGKINSLENLIKVTNSKGTLNNAYTVEIQGLYNTGEQIKIENNVYTFNITPSYYLDSRIATNSSKYVIVDTIDKDDLWGSNKEEPSLEYQELKNKIKKINLDDLEGTTAVGITIENSLSDSLVNSAFDYQNVVVDYIICNETLKGCKDIINNIVNITNELNSSELDPVKKEQLTKDLADNKSQVKIISVDMDNKYQPKEQTVYLDEDYFVRGYRYTIGYILNFTIEDEPDVTYKNDVMFTKETEYDILKQAPIYTQYLSTSNDNSVTYRYSITDIDNDIADKKFYYTLGEDTKKFNKIEQNEIVADGKYHDITIPINDNNNYTLYYASKNTKNEIQYNAIATNNFEKEYVYDKGISYTLIKGINDNTLKIQLANNDVTNRTAAYKVTITADGVEDYTRYFLASQLDTMEVEEKDIEGNPIIQNYKYIAIDYAHIKDFMGKNMTVSVSSYYDSGLMGYNQTFNNGLILKKQDGNYINIFDSGNPNETDISPTNSELANKGVYIIKEDKEKVDYIDEKNSIFIYNKFQNVENYNAYKFQGITTNKTERGTRFSATPTSEGMKLVGPEDKDEYIGYDAKVLNETILNTSDNSYKFNTITPTISVKTTSTINSVTVNITPSGIYDKDQFVIPDGENDIYAYVQLCKDVDCNDQVMDPIPTKINVSEKSIDPVTIENLDTLTTYYIKIWAYINYNYTTDNEDSNKYYTQLYDNTKNNKSLQSPYEAKTYVASTLSAKEIIDKLEFEVKPIAYNNEPTYQEGENVRTTSKKQLKWKLILENTKNYKIRFELYEPDGTTITKDSTTGEEITTTNFKPVQFNGKTPETCDITELGTSTKENETEKKDYIANCYISVGKDDVQSIHNVYQFYEFGGDDFVFGGNHYKLLIYAIPYTNEKYLEEQKVLLYQNNSLTTTNKDFDNGMQNIIINPLSEPQVNLNSSNFTTGNNTQDGNYISFISSIDDTITSEKDTSSYVMLDQGNYKVSLLDEKGNTVNECNYYTKFNNSVTEVKSSDNCEIEMNVKDTGKELRFVNLGKDKRYYIKIWYDIYMNNQGLSADKKRRTVSITDYIYTPVDKGIALGKMTAIKSGNKDVIISYEGASNLKLITKVIYSICEIAGECIHGEKNENIFKFEGISTLEIVTPEGFKFESGKNYKMEAQYSLQDGTILTNGEDGIRFELDIN